MQFHLSFSSYPSRYPPLFSFLWLQIFAYVILSQLCNIFRGTDKPIRKVRLKCLLLALCCFDTQNSNHIPQAAMWKKNILTLFKYILIFLMLHSQCQWPLMFEINKKNPPHKSWKYFLEFFSPSGQFLQNWCLLEIPGENVGNAAVITTLKTILFNKNINNPVQFSYRIYTIDTNIMTTRISSIPA